MKQYSYLLVIILIMVLHLDQSSIYAQQKDCQERYNTALQYFEQGRIDSAYQILISCINDNREMRSVRKSTRGKIYKLAAESAYYLGLYDEAVYLAHEFRTVHPSYTPVKEDLLEFQENVKSARLYPKTTVGLKIIYSRLKAEQTANYSYLMPEGFLGDIWNHILIGLQYKHYVNQKLTIGTELIYGKLIDFNFIGSHIPAKGWADTYLEINIFELPVYVTYNLVNRKNILSYLELGAAFDLTVNSRNSFEPFRILRSDAYGQYYSQNEYFNNAYFFENSLNYNLMTGFGTSFKIGVINIGLNFRYFPKLNFSDPLENISTFEDIPKNEDLYYYDDIYQLRLKGHFQLSLIFGFSLNYQAY